MCSARILTLLSVRDDCVLLVLRKALRWSPPDYHAVRSRLVQSLEMQSDEGPRVGLLCNSVSMLQSSKVAAFFKSVNTASVRCRIRWSASIMIKCLRSSIARFLACARLDRSTSAVLRWCCRVICCSAIVHGRYECMAMRGAEQNACQSKQRDRPKAVFVFSNLYWLKRRALRPCDGDTSCTRRLRSRGSSLPMSRARERRQPAMCPHY